MSSFFIFLLKKITIKSRLVDLLRRRFVRGGCLQWWWLMWRWLLAVAHSGRM